MLDKLRPTPVFLAALLGNVAPHLLRWYGQQGVSLPGQTWQDALGWIAATLLFSVFAGYFAASIWREKSPRRAFVVGLALPLLISP